MLTIDQKLILNNSIYLNITNLIKEILQQSQQLHLKINLHMDNILNFYQFSFSNSK